MAVLTLVLDEDILRKVQDLQFRLGSASFSEVLTKSLQLLDTITRLPDSEQYGLSAKRRHVSLTGGETMH